MSRRRCGSVGSTSRSPTSPNTALGSKAGSRVRGSGFGPPLQRRGRGRRRNGRPRGDRPSVIKATRARKRSPRSSRTPAGPLRRPPRQSNTTRTRSRVPADWPARTDIRRIRGGVDGWIWSEIISGDPSAPDASHVRRAGLPRRVLSRARTSHSGSLSFAPFGPLGASASRSPRLRREDR